MYKYDPVPLNKRAKVSDPPSYTSSALPLLHGNGKGVYMIDTEIYMIDIAWENLTWESVNS